MPNAWILCPTLVLAAACSSTASTPSDDAGTEPAASAASTGSSPSSVGPATGDPPNTSSTTEHASTGGTSADSGTTAGVCPDAGPGPGAYTRQVHHDGIAREYRLHVPTSYTGTTPAPLVLDFHGYTSNATRQAALSGMNARADAEAIVVAHPQGLDDSWNAGGCCGPSLTNDVDDVGFVRAMVEQVSSELCIDPARVFAMGMSNGGFMSHRLACQASDVVAAVTSVAGVIGVSTDACDGRAVPVLVLHGTADELVPWDGGIPPDGAPSPSVPETIDFWVAHNGCDPAPDITFHSGDTTCETWSGCTDDADVTLCTIEGGGHCWPGQPSCPFGSSTTEIDASAAALEFFAAHPMR